MLHHLRCVPTDRRRTNRCGHNTSLGDPEDEQIPSWGRGHGPSDHRLFMKLLGRTLCRRVCSVCGPGMHEWKPQRPILHDAIDAPTHRGMPRSQTHLRLASHHAQCADVVAEHMYSFTFWFNSDSNHAVLACRSSPAASASYGSAGEVAMAVCLLDSQLVKFPSTNITLPPCEAGPVGAKPAPTNMHRHAMTPGGLWCVNINSTWLVNFAYPNMCRAVAAAAFGHASRNAVCQRQAGSSSGRLPQ